jgi:hypothetical protein
MNVGLKLIVWGPIDLRAAKRRNVIAPGVSPGSGVGQLSGALKGHEFAIR